MPAVCRVPSKTYAEPQRLLDEAVRKKQPSPIDVYGSVECSSLIPLTTASVRARGARQEFPHFRRAAIGRRRRPLVETAAFLPPKRVFPTV